MDIITKAEDFKKRRDQYLQLKQDKWQPAPGLKGTGNAREIDEILPAWTRQMEQKPQAQPAPK